MDKERGGDESPRKAAILDARASPPHCHDPTRFVLMHTSHAGNVGAAARAMKVMGFADLVLVRPRFADVLRHEEAVAMASGAADVLARARIVDTLADALDGVTFACATAMTPRDFGPPTHAPRDLFADAGRRRRSAWPSSSAASASAWPTTTCTAATPASASRRDPAYGSLNLAQAVQVIAYDWRQALGGFEVPPRSARRARRPTPRRCRACSTTGRRCWSTSASSTRRRRRS